MARLKVIREPCNSFYRQAIEMSEGGGEGGLKLRAGCTTRVEVVLILLHHCKLPRHAHIMSKGRGKIKKVWEHKQLIRT